MELNTDIYKQYASFQWFVSCGSTASREFSFSVVQATTIEEVIKNAKSELWADARTEAQGDLTGYLAKKHNEAYGGYWNRLAKASRKRMQREIMPGVLSGLAKLGAVTLADNVLLDLNRIALHYTYSQRFGGLPDFFSKLLLVYQKGHLPCGWEGDLDDWPNGSLVVF